MLGIFRDFPAEARDQLRETYLPLTGESIKITRRRQRSNSNNRFRFLPPTSGRLAGERKKKTNKNKTKKKKKETEVSFCGAMSIST